MNYLCLCRVCGEPAYSGFSYNYFQEVCCPTCIEWIDNVLEYTKLKILNACGSYEVFNLLAQVDYVNKELFN